MVNKTFKASLDHLYEMMEFICANAAFAGLSPSALSSIEFASEEVLMNIMTHGYRNEKSDNNTIEIECLITSHSGIEIIVRDRGIPFNPVEASKAIKESIDGGYGIFLIFRMMDKVEYHYQDGMNVLHLFKFIDKGNEESEGHQ